ncbi:hypothetical protein OK016_00795 [Vibrio chagasii]|nr:hypothetical protein [Vibrio chagasii]
MTNMVASWGEKDLQSGDLGESPKSVFESIEEVISDLGREQATASMTKGVVDDMQYAAKQALLDSGSGCQ